MNLIDELMAEVAKATQLNNGEIIVKACERIGVTCPKCNYPPHARLFNELLYQHVRNRIDAHRYRKTVVYMTDAEKEARPLFVERAINGFSRLLSTRDLLEQYWPCEDCTKLFNPTGRVKLGPKIQPTKRGVLDYV